jgi:hypothetical protein
MKRGEDYRLVDGESLELDGLVYLIEQLKSAMTDGSEDENGAGPAS